MPITAEGVEDEATAIELTRLGCSKGQGWHFGRAASAADTDRLLAERGLLRAPMVPPVGPRSEEHTFELQSLMRISYAVFCLKKKNKKPQKTHKDTDIQH